MQKKELHEYVYPLKRKPTEIVIRISKAEIPFKHTLRTIARVTADNHYNLIKKINKNMEEINDLD